MELEYDYVALELLDSQLHFSRLTGLWDYDLEIPQHLLVECLVKKPAAQQRCLTCGKTGHAIMSCPNVTGFPVAKPIKREPKPKAKGVCFDWQRTGTCPRGDKCPYKHRQAPAAGSTAFQGAADTAAPRN